MTVALPVIREFTSSAATVKPGEQFRLRIDAYDPDARTLTFVATAEDTQGGTATATTTVSISDPLKFKVTCDDKTVTVTQDPQNPNEYVASA